MSQNLYDIANNLERAIRQLPEYQAVEAAKQAVLADATAKAIFEDYTGYQRQVQAHLQAGTIPEGDVEAKMQGFFQQIQGNALLSAYFGKQQQLSVYISDLERIIFKPLQELL